MELNIRASEKDETMANRSISAGDVPAGKLNAAERAAERKSLMGQLELAANKMEVDVKVGREVDKMAANLKGRQELWDTSSEMIDEMIMLLHEHHMDSMNEETSDEAEDPEKTQKKGGGEVNEQELKKRLWWASKMMELKEKKREMEERKTEFEETMRNDWNRMRDLLDEYSQLFEDLMDFIP